MRWGLEDNRNIPNYVEEVYPEYENINGKNMIEAGLPVILGPGV